MQKLLTKSIVTVFLTILAFAVGVAQADNRVYPSVTTNWPRLHGASGTKQTAVFGYRVGADDYDFAGQSVITSQRAAALLSLVPSTGVTTPVTFTDGSAANFDITSGVVPLTNGNYAWFGEKLVSTIDTRGSIFFRTSAGVAVTGVHTFGTTNTITRFNKAIQLTGSTYNTKLALVGYTTQATGAGAGDVYYARTTIGSTITAERVATIGTTDQEEGYAIVQVSDTTIAIAGRQKSGTNNNFYVKLINISDGTAVSSFTLSGAAGTGDDDAIRDLLVDGNGDLVLIGTSGTGTGRVGYVAKIDAATGALVAGYEFTTTETDVELYDAELMSDGHIVVTGRQGGDLYLAEIQDNGTAYVSDWAHAYDSGRTGDIGYFINVESDSTILVAGVGNDTGSSTDAAFWLFDAPALQSNANPTAFDLLTPADSVNVALTPTLTWEASTDTLLGYEVTYELTWADNSAFSDCTVVADIAAETYTFGTDLANDQIYYWKVKALDGTGYETECNQAPDGICFFTYVHPTAFNLLTPADSASVSLTPTLTWEAATDTVASSAITYELTWADNSAFSDCTVVTGISGESYEFTSGLVVGGMYYWKVKAIDADGNETLCEQDPDGWCFFTPEPPPDALSVTINSTVESTVPYYDNANIAGFDPLAENAFDAYDIPEPPVLGDNYVQTYIYESGFTGFRQKLTQDMRSTVGNDFTANSYIFRIRTVTDQADSVALSFDVTTNNTDNLPVVFWNGTDYQNMLGATGASTNYKYLAAGSTGSPETMNFAVLIGDETAPVVTPVFPAADSSSEIAKSSVSTLEISVDNTSPIRRTYISFSPEPDSTGSVPNDPRENWTQLANMPAVPTTPDDPTDGIVNANLTFDWSPYADDPALFASSTDVFPEAQLRFITEDWAGNIDTTFVSFAIVPDGFSYTGDYAAGWHLISVPLDPDGSTPAEVFLTHTGNDSGIAGGFSMFEYSLGGGYVQPSTVAIAKGYWLVLNEDNTTAESNSGLGRVYGVVPGATDNVDLALDSASANLIGVTVRNEDLAGNGLQANDWLFSDDNFSTTLTWDEAVTATWIDVTSFKSYDNAGGDFTATIDPADTLVPGVGYLLRSGDFAGIEMRTRRDSAAIDIANPGNPGNGRNGGNIVNATDEFTGEWFVPIRMAIGPYYNDLSGIGCREGATAGWDNGIDVTAPPLPPSGNYVRAVVDGQSWGSPFGRYFVTDVRAPFDESFTSASWDFRVNASENGTITMTFDVASLAEYDVPDNFRAVATVNGETFNLVQSNVVTFNYTGGVVIVHITASLDGTGTTEPTDLLPKVFSIVNSYPNPFNPVTSVRIGLPDASKLQVAVYNTLGRQVAMLADGKFAAGYHNFTFDAHSLASGVYFVRAMAPGKAQQIKRVVLIR
ncbi:MAG: T9SS type A sorting domain-containing protein [bacterium]|nr:T9SS type A sorting domain-containing protein [bacterium]